MSKSTIWISFDLGVRGDYESLYAWLGKQKAKECVNNLALLVYQYSGNLFDALKSDLSASVATDKRTRIYVLYRDGTTKKMKGSFVFGGRRAPVWAGFSEEEQQGDDEA